MNKVILIGNTGQEPQTYEFGNGNKKVSVSLATTERFKNKEGKQEKKTTWHDLQAFGKTGELIAAYVPKGTKIAIEGKLERQEWETEDGQKRSKSVVTVLNMEFLEGGNSRAKAAPAPQPEGDLPF